jgi:hypothetical protein
MKVVKQNKNKKWITVGELLKYIQDNNVPASAEIIIECVDEVYPIKYNWDHVNCGSFHGDGTDELYVPISNGMGLVKDGKKKYLAIHMHY